jgi:hypothetical protein
MERMRRLETEMLCEFYWSIYIYKYLSTIEYYLKYKYGKNSIRKGRSCELRRLWVGRWRLWVHESEWNIRFDEA